MLFSTFITYAEPDYEVSGEELKYDEEQFKDYEFNDELFNELVDEILDNLGDDYYFPGYTENKDFEYFIPHTPLYNKTKGKYVTVKYTEKYFLSPNSPQFKVNFDLTSEYLPKGKITWGAWGHYELSFAHLFIYGRHEAYGKGITDKGIGIDSYGNIITNDRRLIVPFFMNPYFNEKTKYQLVPFRVDEQISKKMLDMTFDTRTKLKDFYYINTEGEKTQICVGGKNKDSCVMTRDEFVNWFATNPDIDREATKQFIKDQYRDIIKEFNEHFLDVAKKNINSGDGAKAYIGVSTYEDARLSSDYDNQKEDLGGILYELLHGGAGRYLKLTLAFIISDFYEEWFVDFASRYIFYTSYYENNVLAENLLGAYITILIMVTILLLVLSVFDLKRGQSLLGVLGRFFLIIIVMVLPVLLYPRFINLLFNKATAGVTGRQVKSMFLLDRWAILSELNQDELNKEIPFTLDRDFRSSQYNYLIEFKTNNFTYEFLTRHKTMSPKYDDKDGIQDIDRQYLKDISNMNNKRVSVYVDANHLIEYFKESDDEELLFDFLSSEFPDNYLGLSSDRYEEYYAYIDDEFLEKYGRPNNYIDIFDTEYLESNIITASELGKELFKYYEEEDIDIYERMDMLGYFISQKGIDNDKRESVINILSDIPSYSTMDAYAALDEDDFMYGEYDLFVLEKDLMELCNYGDILGLYDFFKKITVIKDDEDPLIDILRGHIIEINKNVMEEYITNIVRVNSARGRTYFDEEPFEDAERDVLALYTYFALVESFKIDNFPHEIDIAKVESDVFIRSLLIPFKDLSPDNPGVNHAALYVGHYKSFFTMFLFVTMILIVASYGLFKHIIISLLLLPIMVYVFLKAYVIKEDKESKAWYGALHIILTFAIVHWAFLGLWRFATNSMNSALSAVAVSGRKSFFNTATNMLVVILFFYIVIVKVLYPTIKTAVKNFDSLGGEIFLNNTKGFFKGVLMATGLSKLVGKHVSEKTKKREGDLERGNKENIESRVGRNLTNDNRKTGSKSEEIDRKIENKKDEEGFLYRSVGAVGDALGGVMSGAKRVVTGNRLNKVNDGNITDSEFEILNSKGINSAKVVKYVGKGSSRIDFNSRYIAQEAKKYFESLGYEAKVDGEFVDVNAGELELEKLKEGFNNRLVMSKDKITKYESGSGISKSVANIVPYDEGYLVNYNDATKIVLETLEKEGKINFEVEGNKAYIKLQGDQDKEIIDEIEALSKIVVKNQGIEVDGVKDRFELELDNGLLDLKELVKQKGFVDGVDYVIVGGKMRALNETSSAKLHAEFVEALANKEDYLEELDKTVNVLKNGEGFKTYNSKKYNNSLMGVYKVEKSSHDAQKIYDEIKRDEALRSKLEGFGYARVVDGELIIYAQKDVPSSDINSLIAKAQENISARGD